MLGNIGDLFVKCMRQVTKGHLYHLLGVSDYYVMYRQRARRQRSLTGKLIPLDGAVTFYIKFVVRGREF